MRGGRRGAPVLMLLYSEHRELEAVSLNALKHEKSRVFVYVANEDR